jgi:methionine synthase I (cobalamin-dependent)/5,10-methylenetetrahydrofolate reductase
MSISKAEPVFQSRGGPILIFDGAVGTELYERGFYINRPFEELNLQSPGDVLAVHRSYIEAGAQVITTNTFSITRPQLRKFDIEHLQDSLLQAALKIAAQAAQGTDVRVGLSLGPVGVLVEPLGPMALDEVRDEYERVARLACDGGNPFDLYILETFSNLSELGSAVDGIRRVDPDRPLLASLSYKAGETLLLREFARFLGDRPDVSALGLNCSEGPSEILTGLRTLAGLTDKPIVVQPNAGIPRQINGRYFYMTSPDYMAKYAKRFVEAGASGVGGCCGTGPDHIRAIRSSVRMANARLAKTELPQIEITGDIIRPDLSARQQSKVGQKLTAGQKILSIELNPPKGTDLEPFYRQLEQVEKAGLEFVNVPDGARASTRVSSLHLAAAVRNSGRSKLTVIPHFTTRDRNLIALQADLLGAYVNGVHDVLLVTGDPPKLGNNREATGVYDIDSIGLTHLVDSLNRGRSPNGDSLNRGTGFGIGVASNPTASNLELELKRWRYKCDMGADFAVTQPIYDPESYLKWRELIGEHQRPHLVGIWPFVSLRNAEFMANEVPGVKVPTWALEEMAKAGDDREESIKRGVGIARRVMDRLGPECQGFCVSAPLGKVEVALQLV